MTTKILVSGDARGDLATLFGRVASLHASKGPFDCLLCVGDFFGAAAGTSGGGGSAAGAALTPYTSGELKVPLPCYVLGPAPAELDTPDPDANGKIEIAPGLYCLAGAGIVTLHGLRVAFASGKSKSGGGDGSAEDGASSEIDLLTDGVHELHRRASQPGFVGSDLLLTHEWPRGFQRKLPEGSVPPELVPGKSSLAEVGAERVAEIAAAVRPRYHFCATEDAFFARAPFRQPAASTSSGTTIVTRLVTLASVGNPDKKQKWLHALSLVPLASMSAEQLAAAPENTTDTPYPYAPPSFESHLVVSVGEETYVCLAKGPLLPMHALILPIAHTPCSLRTSEAAAREIDAYVSALRRLFEARGARLLLFERFTDSGSFEHAHLQAVPIPAQLADSARDVFEAHGKRVGVHFEVLPPGESVASRLLEPEPFFAATLPSGETLLHRIRANQGRRHPLHFGREAVASMLGNPRRADWKNCLPVPAPGEQASMMELESRMASDFKLAFEPYDPSKSSE